MFLSDEKLQKVFELAQSAPGLTSVLEAMSNKELAQSLTDKSAVDDMGEFQCSMRLPKKVFLEILKSVESGVETCKTTLPAFSEAVPQFTNEGALPGVLGQIFMFGVVDMVVNSKKYRKELLELIKNLYSEIVS
jgi:hypothetical protein